MTDKILMFNGKTISGPGGTGMVILDVPELPEPEAMTLRFQFSDKGYDPTGVTSKGTWTKVQYPFSNIWDWTCTDTSWATAFGGGGTGIPGKFTDYEHNKVMVINSGDTSAVTDFSRLFQNCYAITSICPIDTSNATTVYCIFSNCWNCEKFPDMDISKVSGNGAMSIFQVCEKLVEAPNLKLPTNNAYSLQNLFMGCKSLKTVPLYDTSMCTNMGSMFSARIKDAQRADIMTIETIPHFDTSNVTFMNQMFCGCMLLKTVPKFNTSKVTKMKNMFAECPLLETVPLFDTSNVNDMSFMMFCSVSLTGIPVFNTSNVTDFSYMFSGNNDTGYQEMHMANIPQLDYSKGTNFNDFMSYNTAIISIPALNIGQAVISANNMFKQCPNVKNGIKDLYDELSAIPTLTEHTDTFKDCGIDTLEGHYQLSQIPTSWGGLLDPNHTVTIGGRTYRTVTIGNQEWMAENLELDVQGSTWYNNDSSYKDKGYGKLYTYSQAMSITPPTGWRLPTKEDIEVLTESIGGYKLNAAKLKSNIEWMQYKGTDDYGFFAIPVGIMDNTGTYTFDGSETNFWTSTEYTNGEVFYMQLLDNNSYIYTGTHNKICMLSIRFVKDLSDNNKININGIDYRTIKIGDTWWTDDIFSPDGIKKMPVASIPYKIVSEGYPEHGSNIVTKWGCPNDGDNDIDNLIIAAGGSNIAGKNLKSTEAWSDTTCTDPLDFTANRDFYSITFTNGSRVTIDGAIYWTGNNKPFVIYDNSDTIERLRNVNTSSSCSVRLVKHIHNEAH